MLRVSISDDALRFLERLPPKHARQLDDRILRLAGEPFPPTCLKLKGTTDVYRVRQGPYRILYRVQQSAGILMIEALGDRKNVYR